MYTSTRVRAPCRDLSSNLSSSPQEEPSGLSESENVFHPCIVLIVTGSCPQGRKRLPSTGQHPGTSNAERESETFTAGARTDERVIKT